MAKLKTNPLQWTMFAGGIGAADDKYSYQAKTDHGDYMIDPISHKNNCNKHVGYRVCFVNTYGKIGHGLYQQLAKRLVNLRDARRLCMEHFLAHS